MILNGLRARRRFELELSTPQDRALLAPPGGPGAVNWVPIGPSGIPHGQAGGNPPVSGRISDLAVGPFAARAYAGSANGGVWLTEDGGTTWAPLDDYVTSPGTTAGTAADSLAVGSLAVRFGASRPTDLLYVGTGEANGVDSYFGIGIRRSAGGGAPGTWTLEATNLAGWEISRVAIDPDDASIVLATSSRGLFRRPAGGSLASWQQLTDTAFGAMATDVIVAGAGAGKRYYVAFADGGVALSPDLATWTALTGITETKRVRLAAGENDPSVVYALDNTRRLFRLSGTVFQEVLGVPQALFFADQGTYDLFLAVDPANADTVYLGGDLVFDGDWSLSLYKGTLAFPGGSAAFPFNAANDMFAINGQWSSANVPNDPTWVGRGIHADGHAIAFAQNVDGTRDGTHVWVGCDGGVFASGASGARGTYTARNAGLAITQMEYLAQRPDTDAVVFAGCQDNGTVRSWGESAWTESVLGDGGGVIIDPNDQYRVMRQAYGAHLSISVDGGVSGAWPALNFPPVTSNSPEQRSAATDEREDGTAFYGPLAVTPEGVTPTCAAFGTRRPWVTADWGATWVTLPTGTNPYVPGSPDAAQDVLDNKLVRALDWASATRLFVATSKAVWRLDRSGATWTRTALPTAGLPTSRFITDLASDVGTPDAVYAALGTSSDNHLYRFDGTTWQAAGPPTSTLNVPCHAVAVDPDHPQVVFLGSDVGCWRGVRSATTFTWGLFSQGLPESAIIDLAVHRKTRLLRAATYGRGVWESSLDASSAQDPDIYLRANYADTGRISGGSRAPWIEGAQDPTFKGAKVYHWLSADIKVRRGSLSGLPPLASPPDLLDYAANIGDYRDSVSHLQTIDAGATNRIFVEVHNRALTALPGSMVRVLLLLTDASAGLPPLPADLAARLNSADTSSWLAGTAWHFADPAAPFRTLPGPLDARVPQVVEFAADTTPLALPAGHDHVCAAAFITTASDPLTSTQTSLDAFTMHDKRVAHRNLHVVVAGSKRASANGKANEPVSVMLALHHATTCGQAVDLLVDRRRLPGHVSLVLPERVLNGVQLEGFSANERESHADMLKAHRRDWRDALGRRIEEVGRHVERLEGVLEPEELECRRRHTRGLGELAHDRPLSAKADRAIVQNLTIDPGEPVWAALTIQLPEDTQPGSLYRLDAIQQAGRQIVGGSTYVVVVPERSRL